MLPRSSISTSFHRLGSSFTPRTLPGTGRRHFTSTPPDVAKTLSFAERRPFEFALGIATMKTSAADLLSQTVAEKKSFGEIGEWGALWATNPRRSFFSGFDQYEEVAALVEVA